MVTVTTGAMSEEGGVLGRGSRLEDGTCGTVSPSTLVNNQRNEEMANNERCCRGVVKAMG